MNFYIIRINWTQKEKLASFVNINHLEIYIIHKFFSKQLKEANLLLQPEKCEFLFEEIAYLGQIISDMGVKSDPRKIEVVQKFPRPKTPRNIKQFLRLAGYYNRFIKDFSAKENPHQIYWRRKHYSNGVRKKRKASRIYDKLCATALYYNTLISKSPLQ